MELSVHPYGTQGLQISKLKQWYKRNGFTVKPGYHGRVLIRRPKKEKIEDAQAPDKLPTG
jgi:hypothetical protein